MKSRSAPAYTRWSRVPGTTYGLLKDLITSAIIVYHSFNLLGTGIGFNDPELTFHSLLVLLTILVLDLLVVLDCFDEFRLHKTCLSCKRKGKSLLEWTDNTTIAEGRYETNLLFSNLPISPRNALLLQSLDSPFKHSTQRTCILYHLLELLLILS